MADQTNNNTPKLKRLDRRGLTQIFSLLHTQLATKADLAFVTEYLELIEKDFQGVEDDIKAFDSRFPQSTLVDLALPSGKLWATQNLGITNTNFTGKYYMWADINPIDSKELCTQTEYNRRGLQYFTGNTIQASSSYNAPYKAYGEKEWMLPTAADFDELFANCSVWSISKDGSANMMSSDDTYTITLRSNHNGKTLTLRGSSHWTTGFGNFHVCFWTAERGKAYVINITTQLSNYGSSHTIGTRSTETLNVWDATLIRPIATSMPTSLFATYTQHDIYTKAQTEALLQGAEPFQRAAIQLAATYLVPQYQDGKTYKAGAVVRIDDGIYQARKDNASPPFTLLANGNKVLASDKWTLLVANLQLDDYLRINDTSLPTASIPEQFEHFTATMLEWKDQQETYYTALFNERAQQLEQQYTTALQEAQAVIAAQQKQLQDINTLLQKQSAIISEIDRTTFLAVSHSPE